MQNFSFIKIDFVPRYREDLNDATRAVGFNTGKGQVFERSWTRHDAQRAVGLNTGKGQGFETFTPRREARRGISAGISQAFNVLDHATTRSAPWPAAGNAWQLNVLEKPTRSRQLLKRDLWLLQGSSRKWNKKLSSFIHVNQISNFS